MPELPEPRLYKARRSTWELLRLSVGGTFAGCKILQLLGEAEIGRGTVKAQREIRLGKTPVTLDVVLKVVGKQEDLDKQVLERFRRESEILLSINHPNLPRVYAISSEKGYDYLLLEYIPGETLAKNIELWDEKGQRSLKETVYIHLMVAEALEYLHDLHKKQGKEKAIIHRNVRPSSIIVTRNQGEYNIASRIQKVILIGSGSAKIAESVSTSGEFTLPTKTTDPYIAPEARFGQAEPRSDLYSLGVSLYHSLYGRDLKEQPGEIKRTSTLDLIIEKLLRREEEFENASMVCQALSMYYKSMSKNY